MKSPFLTDTTGFEEGPPGQLLSNCQRDLDNVFPRGKQNVVHDGIKKERSGPSEGFLARTEPWYEKCDSTQDGKGGNVPDGRACK